MNYHNITKDDMLNGDGLRVVLWVAGCNHQCEDCQNPITWDITGGLPFDEAAEAELFEALDKPYISPYLQYEHVPSVFDKRQRVIGDNFLVCCPEDESEKICLANVKDNYAYIKTMAELAEHFDVSESYLFRIFKQKYDMTPKTYINKLRIKNICKRLKYSEGTIKSVVAEYGFDSYEYFSRVFKKEMGCGPREWMEENRYRIVRK